MISKLRISESNLMKFLIALETNIDLDVLCAFNTSVCSYSGLNLTLCGKIYVHYIES